MLVTFAAKQLRANDIVSKRRRVIATDDDLSKHHAFVIALKLKLKCYFSMIFRTVL